MNGPNVMPERERRLWLTEDQAIRAEALRHARGIIGDPRIGEDVSIVDIVDLAKFILTGEDPYSTDDVTVGPDPSSGEPFRLVRVVEPEPTDGEPQ